MKYHFIHVLIQTKFVPYKFLQLLEISVQKNMFLMISAAN